MYIEKISIVSFGRLSHREIELSPSVNVFEGENESGKSTVAAFIKFILYGMKDKSVGRELTERRQYISWDGASASGSMLVVCGDQRILIERSVAVSEDATGLQSVRESVRMTDVDTGLLLHKGKCPGEVLLGVPEDVFVGTAFVRQIGGARIDGGKMSSAAENLLFSADEAVNTAKAAEKLDLMRRQLLYKNGKGGAIYEKEMKREELTAALERAKQGSGELINTEASISELTEAQKTAIANREKTREKAVNYETVQNLLRFDRLASVREEIEGKRLERERLKADATKNGHTPDEEYIKELRAASDAMAATSSSIASLSRQLEGLSADEDQYVDRELYRTFANEADAGDLAYEEAYALRRRRTTTGVVAAVMLLLAAVSAVLLYLFRDRIGVMLIPAAAAAGVFGLFAVIMTLVSLSAGRKLQKRLFTYGALNMGELSGRLDAIAEAALEYRKLEERIAAAETEKYVQYSVLDGERNQVRELLLRRGIEADDDDVLSAALSDTLSECTSYFDRDRELAAEIERSQGEAEELERQLSELDEASVREAAAKLNVEEYESLSAQSLRLERDFTENAVTRLTESIHEKEVRRAQLMAQHDDPAAISVKLDALSRELEADRARYDACVLAIESLERAGQSVRESVAPRIREYARGYMDRITGGKYNELGVDGSLGVTVSADGAYRELDYMSEGTSDAAYLALRLALVRLLYRTETPPLIFDESFSRMDDRRATSMLSIIAGGVDADAQALIFTCQGREARLLSGITSNGCNIIAL